MEGNQTHGKSHLPVLIPLCSLDQKILIVLDKNILKKEKKNPLVITLLSISLLFYHILPHTKKNCIKKNSEFKEIGESLFNYYKT